MSGMGEPDTIDMMDEHELRKELRVLIHDHERLKQSETDYLNAFEACEKQRLEQLGRLDAATKLKGKLILDTGKGCSVCGHTPVVNLPDGSGTYWLCGDCVQERLNERDEALASLDSALSEIANLKAQMENIAAWASGKADIDKHLARAVEKHERICGVPDPDDECEECIRPLGHDGEHDFSTPP